MNARTGLWALPAYGILLGLSTLTHQPPVDDFDAYARYVTTDAFLISHLGASILGAAAAILGVVAVSRHLPGHRGVSAGLALTTIAQVFLSASFGSAAFAQPGIGRAHLNGTPGMPALNGDTAYGPALVVTALSASALLIVSAIVLGTAVARAGRRLRGPGIAYAVLLPLFVVAGFAVPPVQPIAGFAFAAATAVLAVRLTGARRAGAERVPHRVNKLKIEHLSMRSS